MSSREAEQRAARRLNHVGRERGTFAVQGGGSRGRLDGRAREQTTAAGTARRGRTTGRTALLLLVPSGMLLLAALALLLVARTGG